jgi:glycosyltransferase involved in cell wall biosynthesis
VRTYLIVSADFTTRGGQDRANYALASYLARQGHRVHVVAHEVEESLSRDGDVMWHRAPKPLGSAFLGEPVLQRIGTKVARMLARDDARVITNGGNCDVQADANWVHYVHAAYTREADGPARRLRYRFYHRRYTTSERRAIGRARLVIANSQRTADDVRGLLGVPVDRIRVVYYGIDAERFNRAGRERSSHVLFVGALGDRRKGVDTVFRAWQILCTDPSWSANLLVVGCGADVPRWKHRIAQTGMAARIELLGFRDDIPGLLRNSMALVSPTRYEAYGLAVHEAICCGVPALVSADAGVAERYPHDLGQLLLRDPNDADNLARTLRECVSMSEDQRLALRRFSDDLRRRTWDDMAADIERLIESSRRAAASQTVALATP